VSAGLLIQAAVGRFGGTEHGRLRARLTLRADDEAEIHRRLADDPWTTDNSTLRRSSRGTCSLAHSTCPRHTPQQARPRNVAYLAIHNSREYPSRTGVNTSRPLGRHSKAVSTAELPMGSS
jgi:hypothetical protein